MTSQLKCSSCASPIDEDSVFCQKCGERTNKLGSPSEIILEPTTGMTESSTSIEVRELPVIPDVEHADSTSKKRKTTALAFVTVLILVAATLTIEFRSKSIEPSPSSINSQLSRYCTTRVQVALGSSAAAEAVNNSLAGATSYLWCYSGDALIGVLFYRTNFDENKSISFFNVNNQWTQKNASNYENPATFFVGKGFIAFFGWPVGNTATTEGLFIDRLKKIFGTQPQSTNMPVQNWTEVLPELTKKSFGKPAPVVQSSSNTTTTTTTTPTTTTTYEPPVPLYTGGRVIKTSQGLTVTFTGNQTELTPDQVASLDEYFKNVGVSGNFYEVGYGATKSIALTRVQNVDAECLFNSNLISGTSYTSNYVSKVNIVTIRWAPFH